MSYNVPNVKFNDGRSIPQLGYGVWQVEDEVAEKVVATALEIGYRHIDFALHVGASVIPFYPHPNKEPDKEYRKKRDYDEPDGFHKINTVFGFSNATSFLAFFASHIGIIFVQRIRGWHARSEWTLIKILINVTRVRRRRWSFRSHWISRG